MFKNYLKIAFRNLRRQKGYAFINVFGLALGIACCLLLFLFVRHEWTFDRFHEKSERIYRVLRVSETPGGERELRANLPPAMGPALEAVFPEVEETVRLGQVTAPVTRGEQAFEEEVLLADSAFFEVFTFPLVKGNPETVLDDPKSAVLSREAARKYFGTSNPIGQRLTVEFANRTLDVVVTGVARNAPSTSSIPLNIVLPFGNAQYRFPPGLWEMLRKGLPVARTYVLLSGPDRAAALEDKLPAFAEERFGGRGGVHIPGANEEAGLRLQPLTEVHLTPGVAGNLVPASNPLYSYILAGIALLVLLIACINFMTLSLGRSAGRAKEVGVRKTVGARREQVAFQFWGEALLTSALALFLGVILARGFLPVFNRLADVNLAFDLFGGLQGWLAVIGLAIVVGLVAGGYPAVILSRFRPTEVLKGSSTLGGRRWMTRALVVVQFALSMAFVAGAFVMSKQLEYLSEKALGYNEEHVVIIHADEAAQDIEAGNEDEEQQGPSFYERFRTEALRYPGVKAVAAAMDDFPDAIDNNLRLSDTTEVRAYMNVVSDNFADVMQIDLVAGHGLSARGYSGEGPPALVNQALVRAMGWPSPEAAIGKSVPIETMFGRTGGLPRVVGVTDNFHFQSLHQEVAPFLMYQKPAGWSSMDALLVRIAPGDLSQTMAQLRAVWEEVAPPGAVFEYEFLDEVIDQQYRAEERWRAIVSYAAGFALLIACIGLFGLAALAAQRRTKEIGIRKVLGASVPSIVALLSKDFLKLVALAFVLAAPLAYYAMQRWLQDFTYRIELRPWVFVAAGALVLVVALAAVSYQAVRAAMSDPVDALRYE